MSRKTKLQKQIERETGLSIERIGTRKQLEKCLDGGLARLYQNIFAEPPWLERFSLDEVKMCFSAYFDGGADILVLRDPQNNNRPVAFTVTVPLRAAWEDVRKKISDYAEKKGVGIGDITYFAEDAVDPLYRRKGISSRMKKLRLEACSLKGTKAIVLRTSYNGYPEICVVNKTGGTIISGIFQNVARKRQDGKTAMDRRVYYIFDEETKSAGADVLENVIVVKSGGRDIAIVSDDVAKKKRAGLASRIKKIYPAVRQVIFKDDTVFEGKMYVAKAIKYA